MHQAALNMSVDNLMELLAHVPHWSVVLHGPMIHRQARSERVEVSGHFLIFSDLADAVTATVEQAMTLCDAVGIPFEHEQWSIESVMRFNFN